MRVTLHTYGGLTGRSAPVVIDTDQLDEAARNELQRLISAAAAAPAPESVPDTLRDAQSYEIIVQDGDQTTVLEATDGGVPADFAELRDWLRDHTA
jgi:hypothetical protein